MAVFKCKMCGGTLESIDNSGVAVCEYCGTKQTLPRVDDETVANLFNRANRLRLHSEFDKAEEVYEKIVNIDDTESEAHWGLVLCKYGIEYVEDPDTFERIPTCHRASYDAVTEDDDYLMAIQHADSIRRELYEAEAKRIEELQKDVLDIVKKEKPFDVFICYKETDESGERTEDSVLAQDIYETLTDKGYRVFFARITLENKLGTAYEPYIFAALNSAKVMLVVGTKPEYMDAVWVRNEWSRYLKLMKKDRSKLLIPCYKGMDPYDIPEAFSHLQAQNLAKIGAMQDLVHGVGKIVDNDNAGVPGSVVAASKEDAQLDRAFSFLEDGSFALADAACEQALKSDPDNAMAYVGKLMAELHIKQFNVKSFIGKKYKKNENYQKAMELGDEFVKGKFQAIEKKYISMCKIIPVCVVMVIVFVIGVIFAAMEINYNIAVKEFSTRQDEYTSVYKTFNALNGYKDSEYYASGALIAIGNINRATINDPEKLFLNEVGLSKLAEGDLSRFVSLKEVCFISAPDKNVTKGSQTVEKIVFGEGVTSIGASTFEECVSLREVIFNAPLVTIGDGAFKNCKNLVSISWKSLNGIGSNVFAGCEGLTSIKIPSEVSLVGGYAFENCVNLKSVEISEGVSIIDFGVFKGCIALEDVVLPESVQEIGDYAFDGCIKLNDVKLPSNLQLLKKAAFKNCTNLKNIVIPVSVKKIGVDAFNGCTSIKEIVISPGVIQIGDGAFKDCGAVEDVRIPDTVENIGDHVFFGCKSLKNISIPDSVTVISHSAFADLGNKVINCEAQSKPQGWMNNWTDSSTTVNWGVKQ